MASARAIIQINIYGVLCKHSTEIYYFIFVVVAVVVVVFLVDFIVSKVLLLLFLFKLLVLFGAPAHIWQWIKWKIQLFHSLCAFVRAYACVCVYFLAHFDIMTI